MIVTCGEALVDLMPEIVGGEQLFRPLLGGSLYNVALGVARLGGRAGYLWELSTDSLGQAFLAALEAEGVATEAVRRSGRATPIAVVDLSGAEPRFTIADPDNVMRASEPLPLPRGAQCLVVGSATLAQEPVASAIEALCAGAPLVAIDYNVRRPAIADLAAYRARLARLSAAGGLAKASVADLDLLHEDDPRGYMQRLVECGAGLAVLTMGAQGAMAWTAAGAARVPGRAGPIVDAVGAGDAFMAGLLVALQNAGALTRRGLSRLDGEALARLLGYARDVAVATCRVKGAVMPRPDAVAAVGAAAATV